MTSATIESVLRESRLFPPPADFVKQSSGGAADWPIPVVVNRMLTSEGNLGFDAARQEYVDLVQAGIIDPTKVVRIALENAVSVASVLLLTEATMTEIPEKEKPAAGSMPEM